MKVRKAEVSDVSRVVELGRKFFEQTRQAEFSEYDTESVGALVGQLAEGPASAVFVAETDDGEMVGIAGGMLYPLWMDPSHITGQEMFWYVEPDHRKSRAGKLMFDALENWAREQGAQSFCMVALSHLHEKRVGQMYESKGYVPMERSYIKVL